MFRPAGGGALPALGRPALSLSCPVAAARGQTIAIVGVLGLKSASSVYVSVNQGTPTLVRTNSSVYVSVNQGTPTLVRTNATGDFQLKSQAPASGDAQFTASFAGSRVLAPASASCVTILPPVPAGVPPPPPPPPALPAELPPVQTTLTLACRANLRLPFTGTLGPALGEAPITITYTYTHAGEPGLEKTDIVKTAADGSFSDGEGPPGVSMGEAKASWPGQAGYAGSSSLPCSFTQ